MSKEKQMETISFAGCRLVVRNLPLDRTPPEHDYYCAEERYEECDCKYRERRMDYELNFRYPDADPLPVARLLKH